MSDAPTPVKRTGLKNTGLKERELHLSEEKVRNDRELKERELALSEARLQHDREIRAQEFELKRRELAVVENAQARPATSIASNAVSPSRPPRVSSSFRRSRTRSVIFRRFARRAAARCIGAPAIIA